MDAPSSPLSIKVWPGVRLSALLVAALMLLSLGLHLVNLNAIGNANEYYTAAVQSMLQSGYNFFFVAAEPGGSVTVDKPPPGLWIEAAFAWAFGVSGVVVSLPNILAGVLSVPLLYALVKRYAGRAAGLIAALVMSLTPIFLATNRNNTMDGMLVFTPCWRAGRSCAPRRAEVFASCCWEPSCRVVEGVSAGQGGPDRGMQLYEYGR